MPRISSLAQRLLHGIVLTYTSILSAPPVGLNRIAASSTGLSSPQNLGYSLVISKDQSTVATMIYGYPTATVIIYTNSAGVLTQQATITAPSDYIGFFTLVTGSLALSSDGNTLAIGSPNDNSNQGATWIYTRSGSTWTKQTKLIGTGGTNKSYQGTSVSLSDDGNTLAIGGPYDNTYYGSVWIYTRSGSTWSQQRRLTPTVTKFGNNGTNSPRQIGQRVLLSSDGNTVIFTGPEVNLDPSNYPAGALWAWTRSGTTWTEGPYTTNAVGSFAGANSLVSNGSTTLIAIDTQLDQYKNVVALYTVSGNTINYQVAIEQPSDTVGTIVSPAVSMSSDGTRLLIGWYGDNSNAGAVWEYQNISGTWTEIKKISALANLVGSSTYLGWQVALTHDGQQILFSAINDNSGAGAIYSGSWTQPT